jgi:hypothetical protein
VNINEFAVALRFTSPLYAIQHDVEQGVIVLLDSTGASDRLATEPLASSNLVWDTSGLYFGGLTHEYVISNQGLIALDRTTEEEYETTRLARPGADGAVSVYNVGFNPQDDGPAYLGRVAAVDSDKSSIKTVGGFFSYVGACSDKIVGVTESKFSRPFNGTTHDPADATAYELVQLYPGALPISTVRNVGFLDSASPEAHCRDGVLYFISVWGEDITVPGDLRSLMIHQWDTASGLHKMVPMTTTGGTPVSPRLTPQTLGLWENHIMWVSEDGHALITDVETGVTSELSSLGSRGSDIVSIYKYDATGSQLFSADYSSSQETVTISTLDVPTGRRREVLHASSVVLPRTTGLFLTDVAYSPTWTP